MDSPFTQTGQKFKSEGGRCALISLESTGHTNCTIVVVAFRPQSQPITLCVDSQADLKALNSKVKKSKSPVLCSWLDTNKLTI